MCSCFVCACVCVYLGVYISDRNLAHYFEREGWNSDHTVFSISSYRSRFPSPRREDDVMAEKTPIYMAEPITAKLVCLYRCRHFVLTRRRSVGLFLG